MTQPTSARYVTISVGDISVIAALNDSTSANAVWDKLPVHENARIWGDEIYFPIGLTLDEEDPQETVQMGDLGYWAPGQALCLFFGPTPASTGDEIRPASPVNVLGRIDGDPTVLKQVHQGASVHVTQVI